MSMDGQGTSCRKNIAENLNRLSRAHERYRQTTDGRATAYSERELTFTFTFTFTKNWLALASSEVLRVRKLIA